MSSDERLERLPLPGWVCARLAQHREQRGRGCSAALGRHSSARLTRATLREKAGAGATATVPSREKAGAGARPLPVFPSREKAGAAAARSLPLSPRHCQCSRSGRTREYPETQTRTGKREHGREGNKGFLKEVLLNHIVERSQGAGCNLSPKREGKCEMVSACVPKETF